MAIPATRSRVLCTSLLQNGGTFTADKTIKLNADTSILGDSPGDEISLDEPAFTRLAEAYFAEIERKYP